MPTGVPFIDRQVDGTGLLIHYPREEFNEVEKEKKKKSEKRMLRKRKSPDFRPEYDALDLERNRSRQSL